MLVRTEQGHQQHHHHDVLHVPPLVQIQQDAEDHQLYELHRSHDMFLFIKEKSKGTFIPPLIVVRTRARGPVTQAER